MAKIPGVVHVEIDEALLPPGPAGPAGPAGSGVVRQRVSQSLAPGTSTSATSYAGSGLIVTLTPLTVNSRIVLRCCGVVCHDTPASIVHFSFKRNGAVLTLPGLESGVSCVRCVDSSYTHPFSFEFEDQPGTASAVTYELAWRVHGGTAYLGKRPGDAVMYVPTRLAAEEYIG